MDQQPAQPPVQQPIQPPVQPTPMVGQQPVKPKSNNTLILGVIFLVIILLGGGYMLYAHFSASKTAPSTMMHAQNINVPTANATPGVTPVTSANVDDTLNQTDNKIDQAVNQANADLNQVNSIDPSQDSTSNL